MTETNFKHTDLGLIPHDWEVKTLGDIYNFRYGDGNTNPANGGQYPVYGANGIIGGYDKYNAEDSVVVGHIGDAGSINWATGKHFVTYNGTITTVKDKDVLFGRFGYFVLLRADIKRLCAGSSQPFLSYDLLNVIKCALPPTIAEQERIAGALSSIDNLISALTEQIEKKRHIQQGAMQQLLTGKKRLAGFTGEWKEVRLGDVAKMNSGGTPTSTNPAYYNGDIPFLSISDMTSSGKYIQSTEKTITQLGLENSSARLFPAGTLMYAMYASIGKCSITNIDTAISQAILGFKLSDALDRDYLYYHFCFIENIVKDMGQTGTQSNLSKKIVEDFELTIPPTIAEQSAIAAVLSRMDTEIAALEQKRDKYIAIKSGMMQNLLTGKIRLV